MRKHKHFKVKGFLNFWLEAEIHAVPKIWEKWIYVIQEKYGKHRDFPYFSLPRRFRVDENPRNSQRLGMYKFPKNGNIMWKAIAFLGCGFLRKLEVITKPK